jgi:hypothetical protein
MNPPPTGDNESVRLAKARNPQEAYIWRDVLAEAEIQAQVVGDFLAAGYRGLYFAGPEVRVRKRNLEKARQILAAYPSTGLAEPE